MRIKRYFDFESPDRTPSVRWNHRSKDSGRSNHLRVIDGSGVQTLGALDVDGLDVGVQTLLGTLLVVTLARDADTQAEGDTLDTGFPDLLVELGVEANVLGALWCKGSRLASDDLQL